MDDPLALDDSHTPVDEDVLHWVTTSERGAESPYSQFGTLVAKVRTLFPFLVDVARERARTDHGAIARECGIHAARQGALLRIVGRHEAYLGRPLLPAVVTRSSAETPGDVAVELVERTADWNDDVPETPAERRWLWETEREKVYRTWSETGPGTRAVGHSATVRTTGTPETP